MADAHPSSLVLVGAGLQNALIALAALDARPDQRVVVLERAERACGNHTWCFHESDVPVPLRGLVSGLTAHQWPSYDVRFPERSRRVEIGYACMESRALAEILDARLAAAPNGLLRTGADVRAVDARGVTLASGERVEGDLVVDARGPSREPDAKAGYQKFLGVELAVDAPHGLERPLLMDATLEQVDGFRFLYVLPLGPSRLLVEDTVFSASPTLDVPAWRTRVLDEARARGWLASGPTPEVVVREEHGVLPMPWSGSGPEVQDAGPLRAGYQGRWFHPATGYSAPLAMRLAALIQRHLDRPSALFGSEDYRRLVRHERRQTRFARFLNRLLFTGVEPDTRWTVFDRFYTHPEAVISRFYACALTPGDRVRMLVGRPPRGFSVRHALAGSAIR